MALRIRLRQQGRNNRQTFRLVLSDSRSPRDGKYIEMLGWSQPLEPGQNAYVNAERTIHWLSQGASLSEEAKALVARIAPEVMKALDVKREAKEKKKIAQRRAAKSKKG